MQQFNYIDFPSPMMDWAEPALSFFIGLLTARRCSIPRDHDGRVLHGDRAWLLGYDRPNVALAAWRQ